MAGEVHVIVGCGGTGIKTLKRLNRLLSQDFYWRRRLDNDVYYVVVDTDVEEMREFEASVQHDLAGAPDKPYICSVQLSRGETHLQPLVDRYFLKPFEGGENPEGRERLLEHWWNKGPESPFIAPAVKPVTKGAGQCPPVSYFLTWKQLKNMERQFDELIHAIQRRRSGLSSADELNFLIVAGLAGGTGRGSWELIAFKLRELFGGYEHPPTPRAFLFDSSVYQNIYQKSPEQKTAMRVNALTGVSQLSCWIANKKSGHTDRTNIFSYQLPSFESPESEEADVLKVNLELDVNSAAPVDHAYLIFSKSGVTRLADSGQYYEMAAAGIYGAISKSSLDRVAINSKFNYVGLATAIYEVNAATLRRYFEAQARVQSTKMMLSVDSGKVRSAVEAFFRRTSLLIDVTSDDPCSYYFADPDGLFLQKVLDQLERRSRGKVEAVRSAMDENDVDQTKQAVAAAMRENEDLVQDCLRTVIEEHKLNPFAFAEQIALSLFEDTDPQAAGESDDAAAQPRAVDPYAESSDAGADVTASARRRVHSVANVLAFIRRVQAALAEEIEEMPAELPWGKEDPQQMAEDFAGRPIPWLTSHYNEGERRKLIEAVQRGVSVANYSVIKAELEKLYSGWVQRLDRLAANAEDLLQCIQKLEHRFARQRDRTVPQHDQAFEALFTPPEQPESGLGRRFSAEKFYHRELKPVLAAGQDLELIASAAEMSKELFGVVRGALVYARQFSETEAYDVRKRLAAEVEAAVRDTVGLPDRFIEDHFAIRKVIRDLVAAWRVRLAKAMTASQRAGLEERFEEFFGFAPRRNEENVYDFPDQEEFIMHMSASLSRTCKPYWQLRSADSHKFDVVVFAPTMLSREAATTRVNELVASRDVTVEVIPELQTAEGADQHLANPFVLLSYSTEGVDEIETIESLYYYAEDGEVFDLVRGAENPDGETIFHGARNGGMGYVDPLYVNHEQIRALRWRPWVGDEEDLHAAQSQQAVDALLYSLFPGDASAHDLLAELDQQLQGQGWVTPLIRHRGRGRYEFTRLPLLLDAGQVHTDLAAKSLSGWDAGKPVAQHAGLANVWKAFSAADGEGRPDWRTRILTEAELFWGPVLLSVDVAPGAPRFRNILQAYGQWLLGQAKDLKEDDPNKPVWDRLLARLSEMQRGT